MPGKSCAMSRGEELGMSTKRLKEGWCPRDTPLWGTHCQETFRLDPFPPLLDVSAPVSILAWRIPWTEEPGRLQSLGLHSQTRLK